MSLIEEFKKLNKACQKPRYKEAGNWMVRNIIREACVPATYFLLKTPVTANQVTFFSIVLGIGGCAAFLAAPGMSFVWMAVLLQLSYYFDHVDGQIARCKGQVSLSGMMFDFIGHYIIYGAIAVSLGLKAYHNGSGIFYVYCGIVAAISIISFNLLVDSKCRAFFVELLKHDRVRINRPGHGNKGGKRSIPARFFSLLHKTCEMHVIINTVTVIAVLQLFGMKGVRTSFIDAGWTEILAVYYAAAAFMLAVTKTFFVITRRKPDEEFRNIFLTEGE